VDSAGSIEHATNATKEGPRTKPGSRRLVTVYVNEKKIQLRFVFAPHRVVVVVGCALSLAQGVPFALPRRFLHDLYVFNECRLWVHGVGRRVRRRPD